MLRDRDYLLTLAAIWLLFAALSSNSKPKFVITASAASQRPEHNKHSYFNQEQPMKVDLLMLKIKQNLDQPKKPTNPLVRRVQPDETLPAEALAQNKQNNYSHFANETDQQHPNVSGGELKSGPSRESPLFREAKEVRVDRLRSSSSKLRPQGNATSTVFLLNHNSMLPQLANNHIDRGPADVLTGSEQQQQQPFMFPPNANSLAQQQNIREILQNYQRYPQARQHLTDQQRQMLTQLQPRPPELHLRPPTTPPPAFGLTNGLAGPQQQQQQMLSPLQLLAGPLQAFQQALTGQQQQQQQPNPGQQVRKDAPSGDNQADRPATRATPQPNSAAMQQPLGGLLNAFNLGANRPQQGNGPPNAAGGGFPNLQDFYQQLPLYQALLAARQRQEALQAAERVRQQQQGAGGLGPFNLNPLMPPPAQSGIGGNALPLPPAPPFATGLPPANRAFGPAQQAQPNQRLQSNGNQNLWPASRQNSGGQPQQQQPPTSNQVGPVQFDDDDRRQDGQQVNNNNNNQQQQQNKNDKHDNGNQQQENENNNNGPDNSGDQNQGDDQPQSNGQSEQQPNGKQQADGGQDEGGSGKAAEEEDPDLKQFQNLANGGDSFTDLFPPGILSNNDISEIKTQQAEQEKKREAEERQRQQQQQLNNQLNQFAGQNSNGQNAPQDNNQERRQQTEIDNNKNNENEQNGQNEGQGGGQNEDEQEDDEGQGPDSPTAAALTAKSSSASETTNSRTRLSKSPGVEYAEQ